ncbi:dephospho-CoA kinase [Salinibacterium sp. M195]|uniref:dephospho-CoA kinase n=1 Tax=Salinibacterium sp. M195 TaxID=2583374 RepID=UPI001C63B768|nr:dephospho-CoA kinase [Salinibacterium sp. M195]QYH36158.1 dephospho-CoA kinase [Salinibacterium sp. M195]
MHLIALTGGIASGKSTVAHRWQERGAVIVDADALAREVVAPGSPALDQIVQRFGPEMLHGDGALNRQALGAVIFGDDDARRALNGITHPAIGRLAQARFDDAAGEDANAIVVYDIPLLVETAQSLDRFALVATVEAAPEVRIQRLIDHRSMTRDEAEGRIASQATSAQRRAVADFVIDTDGTLGDTQQRADDVWDLIVRRLSTAL